MSILQIKTEFVGQVNVNPRLVRIVTDDNLTAVTTVNWLRQAEFNGYPLYPTDFVAVAYDGGSGWFFPSIDLNGNITLEAGDAPGGVTVSGSVTTGDLVQFAGPTTISDVGYKILHGTSSTFAGGGTSFSFTVTGCTLASNAIVVMKNQTNTASITSIGAFDNSITVTFSADPGTATRCNYIVFVPNS